MANLKQTPDCLPHVALSMIGHRDHRSLQNAWILKIIPI